MQMTLQSLSSTCVEPHLVDGFCAAEHNERKPSRPPCVGICLHIYALDLTIFTEVFPQLLCWGKGEHMG